MIHAPVSAPPTTTIIGVDEAGYGPVLGPLVISAVAFDVPTLLLEQAAGRPSGAPDLWALLRSSVSRRPLKRGSRLAVADSKKLYGTTTHDVGMRLLERAALTFLAQMGDLPATLRGLLQAVCPDVVPTLAEYPWYADGDVDLPAACRADDLRTQANALASDLRKVGVRFRGAWVSVLPAGQFNRLVGVTRNKATVLFGQTLRLVQTVADRTNARPLAVWLDRQGGRCAYRQSLMTAFDDAYLVVVGESSARSSYRLERGAASWAIHFVKNGETHHLPIALASIVSKYIRELFMTCFNRYWSAQLAGLRPTAGYYRDGQRFLADIEKIIAARGLDRQVLVRIL